MPKNLVSGVILVPLTKIWAPKVCVWILPVLDVRSHCKLSLYVIWKIRNEPILRNSKTHSFWLPNFFLKIWLCQSLDIMVSYHQVQYQKKLMIQSWENVETDRETEGRGDGRKWLHKMLSTNVERPKILLFRKCFLFGVYEHSIYRFCLAEQLVP